MSANQQRAANEYRLPNVVAARLRGEDWEAVAADAESIVSALAGQAEAEEPEHVRLARQAIEAAKNNPNQAELAALSRSKPSHAAIGRALHPGEIEP